MDKEKIIAGIVGGIVAGFSIGVGFMIAQKTIGRWGQKKSKSDTDEVAEAVKKGVTEGVKQAKTEQDAANFAAMNASQGGRAKRHIGRGQQGQFMGFNGKPSGFVGDPSKMNFSGDPLSFGSTPNGALNSF